MDFSLFDSLSARGAHDYLQSFLHTEKAALEAMAPVAKRAGIRLDYSMVSLASVLKWLLGQLDVQRVAIPATEPKSVRDFHQEGLVDFPEDSRRLILRAAYYLGESFVRARKSLSWTVGNPEFAEKNMPVVAGFRDGDEMAPIMVCKNVFSRILGGSAPDSDIDRMIETWRRLM